MNSNKPAIEDPNPGIDYPYQDTAPLPWVSVIPSERAIGFKVVNFDGLAHQIRYDMNFSAYREKYKNVTRVLVDYAILPKENFEKSDVKMKKGGQSYPCVFESTPERYVLTTRFYDCNQTLADTPLFEETITMPTSKAPPHEALHLMAHMIMEDHHSSSLNKIKANLN